MIVFLPDEYDFIQSVWKGSYVCADDNRNISYFLNVSKADANAIVTIATLNIDGMSLAMTGTYASFAKTLALQSRGRTTHDVFGNSFKDVEINMDFITSLYMTGAVVFRSSGNNKNCRSELRRIYGKYCNPTYFGRYYLSHLMRLWYFSSSVNSFFERAYAAI